MNYIFEIIPGADNELIKRVFMTQNESPSQGDFVNLLRSDFEFIGIIYDEKILPD